MGYSYQIKVCYKTRIFSLLKGPTSFLLRPSNSFSSSFPNFNVNSTNSAFDPYLMICLFVINDFDYRSNHALSKIPARTNLRKETKKYTRIFCDRNCFLQEGNLRIKYILKESQIIMHFTFINFQFII